MTRLTLIVPYQSERQKQHADSLRARISLIATGLSIYQGEGEWRDPEHLAIVEEHQRFEILDVHSSLRVQILEAFRAYGRAAEEHTLLWWQDEVEAHFEEVPEPLCYNYHAQEKR